jgi:putative ABC transport system permease protein
MQLLRNLGRRKLRTSLTILGITIGIWALVVFGSMANKINALVAGGSQFYEGKVTVTAKGAAMSFGSPVDISAGDRIASLDGVDIVVPGVSMLLADDGRSMSMSMPQMIRGQVADADQGRETFPTTYASGRALTPADEGSNVAVLGSDIAREHDTKVGDTMTLRGESFHVVGILEPTLTAPDTTVVVPLKAAQRLFVTTLPTLVAANLDPATVATGFTVYPTAGADPETIADEIRASASDLEPTTAKDFDSQIGSATSILNSILVGIALISLAVGGLSVINTMAMSVAERTREIGIKRAIGGGRLRIVRELVTESAMIGFLGGATGLVLGAILVTLVNEAGRSSGTVLFQLTTGTAFTAVGFSTVLGALAGLIPAMHAARLDPVTALRYE